MNSRRILLLQVKKKKKYPLFKKEKTHWTVPVRVTEVANRAVYKKTATECE